MRRLPVVNSPQQGMPAYGAIHPQLRTWLIKTTDTFRLGCECVLHTDGAKLVSGEEGRAITSRMVAGPGAVLVLVVVIRDSVTHTARSHKV